MRRRPLKKETLHGRTTALLAKGTTRLYARRIVQCLAVMLGVLGLVVAYIGLRITLGAAAGHDWLALGFACSLFALSGFSLAVAYQAVFKYSTSVVTSVSALLGLVIFGFLTHWTHTLADHAWQQRALALHGFWLLLPLALAWLFYRLVKGVLLKLTVPVTP